MAKLSPEVKLRRREAGADAGRRRSMTAGLEIPEWLRTGASAPADAPVPPGEVAVSATGADPQSERKEELEAQKAEAAAEARDLIGGQPGGDTQPAAPRTAEDDAARIGQPSGGSEGGEAGRGTAQAGRHADACRPS